MIILEDLYIFLFGLSILLLSVMITAGMTFTFCIIMTAFTKRNKESDKGKKEDGDETAGQKQEETADEKRRKRNAEIIKKYMH